MERYLQIEKVNLKYNIPLHILICVLLLLVSPLLMGVENLKAEDTAKVLEVYAALMGIILLPPVFLPEQDRDIRDLVYTKRMNVGSVYMVRLLGNVLILAALLGAYVGILLHNGCEFPAGKYFLGTFAEMLFMGGLGLCFYGMCDNLVIGYMAPIVYYIVALGGGPRRLGMFYPFSMMKGSYTEKAWLAAGALALAGAGILFRCRRK